MEILLPILGVALVAWFMNFRTQEQRTNLGLPNQKIRCPDCLGKVPVEAKKCMHCGCSLSALQNQPTKLGSFESNEEMQAYEKAANKAAKNVFKYFMLAIFSYFILINLLSGNTEERVGALLVAVVAIIIVVIVKRVKK
jgi:hypothetical protein